MSAVVEDITPFLPGDTVAYLRIADGDRRFPFRPIASGLFLLGAGPCCDLRLGLSDVPAIHSVIQVSSDSAEISRVADQPELVVNGEAVCRYQLCHGDVIEIGDVRLAFFQCVSACSDLLRTASQVKMDDADRSRDAIELVTSLEAEMELLSYEDSSRERIHELLKAAQGAIESRVFADTIRFSDYVPMASHDVGNPMSDQAVLLARLDAQDLRLNEICSVLEQVVKQQQIIATALQCIVDRMEDIKTSSQPGPLRASA